MNTPLPPSKIAYFGKVPARGDFIKAADNAGLITRLDHWLAQAMELLTAEARWKILYDELRPMHFAFIGLRSEHAIAGHLVASMDQARRRFPFLAMRVIDTDKPCDFVKFNPLILAPLWRHLERHTAAVITASDPGAALHDLVSEPINPEPTSISIDTTFTHFLAQQTLGGLNEILASAGFPGTTRQLLLALGMLLAPVMASGCSHLEKSLVLPLSDNRRYSTLVATFWMHLIAPFLQRSDFQLAVFITKVRNKPCLVIGFNGASPRVLHALMVQASGAGHQITFDETQWVEDQVEQSPQARKLSIYLSQHDLSLKSAHGLFHEAFIGA